MNDNKESFDEWLLTLAACGIFTGFLPVTAVCAPLWVIRKGTKPTLNAISATGKGAGAMLSKTKELMPEKKEADVLLPTKAEQAKDAVQQYEDACGLIDAMPLDDSEKESMKIHAKRQLIEQMWGLLK